MAILRPVFEALAYAHDEGIAHRDIKPGNMILTSGRRGVSLRLLDFGIAKIMEGEEKPGSGLTRTQNAMQAFSPKYAAPEQIGGSRTGPWTDVHALGLVLTEVLTDLAPYDGRDITARFSEALSPVRPTPLKRKVDVGTWEPVIARAVSLVPGLRFPTAGDFLTALESTLPGATGVRSTDPLPETRRSTPVPLPPASLPPTSVPALAPTALPERGSTLLADTATSTLRPAEIAEAFRPGNSGRSLVLKAGGLGVLLGGLGLMAIAFVHPAPRAEAPPVAVRTASSPAVTAPVPALVAPVVAPVPRPVLALPTPPVVTPLVHVQAPAPAFPVQASPVVAPRGPVAPPAAAPVATQAGRAARGHRRRRAGDEPLAEPMVATSPGFPPAPAAPAPPSTRLGAGDM